MKNIIYELLRKHVAKRATGNLGKVVITDTGIVCFVDGKKLKKKDKYSNRYNLIFKCIHGDDELYKIYNLNNPVLYIVDGVEFDTEVNIQASIRDCHVTFSNCTFNSCLEIDFADHLTFINNKYKARDYRNYRSIVPQDEFYISTRDNKNEINKIVFIGDSIGTEETATIQIIRACDSTGHTNSTKKPIVRAWLYAKTIGIYGSNIINAKDIHVETDNLELCGTNITSEEIEIKANRIVCADKNCSINSDVISLEIKDKNSLIGELHARNGLFVNGVEIDKKEKVIYGYDLEIEKQKKRVELISTLKKIKESCEETIKEKIRKQPIKRILKK